MEWTSLVQWDGMEWTFVGIPPVCPLLPMVQWDGMEWTSLEFSQCGHYFSHGGTVGWDGHLSDSWECPKNIRTIWDSHCTIGHLLAMLDMTGSDGVYLAPEGITASAFQKVQFSLVHCSSGGRVQRIFHILAIDGNRWLYRWSVSSSLLISGN